MKTYNGAIIDPIDERDYKLEEVGMFAPVNWIEKKGIRQFEVKDQSQSSSCVANAVAKILAIENYLEEGRYFPLSARDLYTRRTNNGGGMNFREAMKLGHEKGITLEYLMPSNGKGEAEMNKADDRTTFTEMTGSILAGGNYISTPFNIDSIASVINQGKGVLLGFRFDYDEWDLEVPIINPKSKLSCHHGVAGIDFTIKDGKRAIVIDESWGFRNITQRYITEDWFINGRVTASWYFEDLLNIKTKEPQKIKYRFDYDLYYGMRSPAVSKLQEILISEGYLFIREPTGYFGNLTLEAVKNYQRDNKISPVSGYVGPKTREVLNHNNK